MQNRNKYENAEKSVIGLQYTADDRVEGLNKKNFTSID